jgi:3-oxoacyl-[acyl-carrier-protein] synthase-1
MSASVPRAFLTGLGALTAIGLTAPQTAAAIRANIARFGELPEMFDDAGEPVIAATVPLQQPRRAHRLTWLCWRAAVEALSRAGLFAVKEKTSVAVLLALPDATRPDVIAGKTQVRKEVLRKALSQRIWVKQQETIAAGHAAVFLALARAFEILDAGVCDAALILSADSLISASALEWLDDKRRLKAAYAPKGFVPGEAAAALVLEKRPPPSRTKQTRVWAQCFEVAKAVETVGMEADAPALAAGLTDALQQALDKAQLQPRDVEVVLCDLNGEPYRANDWCFARNRVLGRAGDLSVWHPADCLGDVGAASGGILAALAGVGLVRGYWRCPRLLLWAASDSGQRAALFLGQPEGAKQVRA